MALRLPISITIPEQYFWEDADIIVKRIGASARAVDGDSRETIAEDNNHSYVLKKAIEKGDTIAIKGELELKETVPGKDGVILVGKSTPWFGKTKLIWKGSSGGTMLDFTDLKSYGVLGIIFDGNSLASTAIKTGGDSVRPKYLILQNLGFWNFIGTALDLGVGKAYPVDDTPIINAVFQNCKIGIDGIYTEVKLISVGFGGGYDKAIVVRDGATVRGFGVVFSSGKIAIALESDGGIDNILFVDVWFEGITQSWLKRTTTPTSKYINSIVFIGGSFGVPSAHDESYYILDLENVITDVVFIGGSLYVESPATATIHNPDGSDIYIIGMRNYDAFQFSDTSVKKMIVLDDSLLKIGFGGTIKSLSSDQLLTDARLDILRGGLGWVGLRIGYNAEDDARFRVKTDGKVELGDGTGTFNTIIDNINAKARIQNVESIQIPTLSDCANLPASGNFAGDMRVCYDTGASAWKIKVWDGSAWREVTLS